MKKSLIALAVLAAAGAASAQSSVTLGGIVKEGVARTSFSGASTGSNTALVDGSSRFLISGTEDLGGGLAAYFQIDSRFRSEDNGNTPGSLPATTSYLGTGNTFIGLRGGWGAFQAGKMDTHYCTSVNDDFAGNGTAVALAGSSCALQGFVNGSGGAGRSIAVTSRAVNSLRYVTPNLSGFTGQVTYSFNPYGQERAVNATTPRGGATQLGLNYDQGPLAVRFSYWRYTLTGAATAVATTALDGSLAGAPAAGAIAGAQPTPASQRAWTLGAGYDFGVAKVGLTYDRSELRDLTAGGFGAVGTAQRSVWILPVTVPLGTGQLMGTYARASNVKLGVGGTAANTGAKMLSLGYNYPLSKRTSVGVSYTKINNDIAASYQLYTNSSLGNAGQFGTTTANTLPAGTDQSLVYLGMRHVF
jgi:predicted porin